MDDPSRLTLAKLAKAGLPLNIPWMKQAILPGTGLNSDFLSRSPWTNSSPFQTEPLHGIRLVYMCDENCQNSYRSAESTSCSRSDEHYSGSLGLTVGCSFLKANVTGSYDKTVITLANANKVSRNGSCGVGTIKIDGEPRLTIEAQQLLGSAGGELAFQKAYGDYYVAAYNLGANAGVLLAAESGSTDTTDKFSVTESVKAFFWTASHTDSHVENKYEDHINWTFVAYDTLSSVNDSQQSSNGTPLSKVSNSCSRYLDLVQRLEARVDEHLQQKALKSGTTVNLARCKDICNSGLVSQLLLLPYRALRQYREVTIKPKDY